jgi:micrococcal nuclease
VRNVLYALIPMFLFSTTSLGQDLPPTAAIRPTTPAVIKGPVQADVISVYDGDTFWAVAYPWPNQIQVLLVRVRGINAPEIRGQCPEEHTQALKARDFATPLLMPGLVELTNIGADKYGERFDADVKLADGRLFGNAMLQSGLVRPYHYPDPRGTWCPPKNP